jgi:hypothetical protein
MASRDGLVYPPTCGFFPAAGGQSQKRVTPATRSPSTRSKRISVRFGARDTIRCGGVACAGEGETQIHVKRMEVICR